MKKNNIRIDQNRLKRLLARMMNIYSPSGKEEELIDFLHTYLKRKGLPVVRQEVDEHRDNLLVRPKGEDNILALVGHVDTVTAFDLEDFGYKKNNDMISGLGAADMKAGCAALIEAYIGLWEKYGYDLPVTLALVVGEEEDGDGAEILVNDYYFPWAVIAEPTNLKPCLNHYGYVAVRLATQGEIWHASLAQKGLNAVENMLDLCLVITRHFREKRPELVYNIRDLYSSGGGFVVPEGCEAWIDLHLPPSVQPAEITLEIEELTDEHKKGKNNIKFVLQFDTVHSGYAIPEKGKIVEALKAVYQEIGINWQAESFPSHSDANQLWTSGVKPIVLGPGSLEKAHRPDESISWNEVVKAAEIYFKLGEIISL